MKVLPTLVISLSLVVSCAYKESTTELPTGYGESALASWQGESRTRLVDFIRSTSDPNSADFIPVAERIAVFDNDGTLWSEQPIYVQLVFAMDRVQALGPDHPEWGEDEVLQAAATGDMEAVLKHGNDGVFKLLGASHAGMTAAEFDKMAREWMETARHPDTGRAYNAMVYQPMLELIDSLHANQWQVWIVSGGGVAFMRPWTEEIYGIPPERVIGSRMKSHFEMREDGPVIIREAELGFLDDKEGKPVAIYEQIGRRPRLAFGNSDGDLQMLQWTMAGDGARLAGLVHHTDAEREVAYDRESHVGRLDAAWTEAEEKGWLLVDMAQDWTAIYPAE